MWSEVEALFQSRRLVGYVRFSLMGVQLIIVMVLTLFVIQMFFGVHVLAV